MKLPARAVLINATSLQASCIHDHSTARYAKAVEQACNHVPVTTRTPSYAPIDKKGRAKLLGDLLKPHAFRTGTRKIVDRRSEESEYMRGSLALLSRFFFRLCIAVLAYNCTFLIRKYLISTSSSSGDDN